MPARNVQAKNTLFENNSVVTTCDLMRQSGFIQLRVVRNGRPVVGMLRVDGKGAKTRIFVGEKVVLRDREQVRIGNPTLRRIGNPQRRTKIEGLKMAYDYSRHTFRRDVPGAPGSHPVKFD